MVVYGVLYETPNLPFYGHSNITMLIAALTLANVIASNMDVTLTDVISPEIWQQLG